MEHRNFKRVYFVIIHPSFIFLLSVSFAQIDWHDFVVVETVEFKENETGIFRLQYRYMFW